jgi:hypothetical protein
MSEPTNTPESTTATPANTATPETPPRGEREAAPIFGDRLRNDAMSRALAALERNEGEAAAESAEPEPAAEATPEPKVDQETTAEKPAATQLESDRFVAALEEHRKAQRQLDAQRREYEGKLAQLESEKASLSKLAQARAALDADDPLTALAELGVSYEDLTRRVIGGASPKAQVKTAEQERLERLEAALEQQKTLLAQRDRDAALRSTVDVVRSEVPSTEYPLLAAQPNWEHEIIEGIRLEWEKVGFEGDLPPVSARDVAERIEAYLYDDVVRRAKLSPKVLAALSAQNDPSHVNKAGAQAVAQPVRTNGSARTLTSADSGNVSRIAKSDDIDTLKARAAAVLDLTLRDR